VRSIRHKQEIRYELNTSVVQDLAHHLIRLVASIPEAEPKEQRAKRGRTRPQEA
jgi:hypothetical protein